MPQSQVNLDKKSQVKITHYQNQRGTTIPIELIWHGGILDVGTLIISIKEALILVVYSWGNVRIKGKWQISGIPIMALFIGDVSLAANVTIHYCFVLLLVIFLIPNVCRQKPFTFIYMFPFILSPVLVNQ